MMRNCRSAARSSALWLVFFAIGCGGGGEPSSDPVGPQAGPGFMVGDWIAESMVVTSLINPDVSPDIVQFGAAFTLTVQPSGRYTAILSGYGQSSSESGTLTVEGTELVFRRELPTAGESRAVWERNGSAVIFSGATNFDFNLDGTTEAASVRTVLVPR